MRTGRGTPAGPVRVNCYGTTRSAERFFAMNESPRVIVIGGGPIGLEAAAYGNAAGLEVVLLERQEVGANVARWGFLQMFTPWRLNTTPLGRSLAGGDPVLESDACPTGQEYVDRYLLPMAESAELAGCVEAGVRVLAVGREEDQERPGVRPFRVLTCDAYGQERVDRADVVLDCTGTYGNRRWAGRGGMPAMGEAGAKSSIWYTVPDATGADRARFEGRRTLLIGAGTTALCVLSQLATLAAGAPGTRVVWCVRRWGEVLGMVEEDPLPVRRALAESALRLLSAPPPWLEVVEDAMLERIAVGHGLHAWLRTSGEWTLERQVDEVVAAIGFRPDESLHDALAPRPMYVNAAATQAALAAGALEHPDAVADGLPDLGGEVALPMAGPGYYLVGHKSFGTNNNFLLRVGHRQVREVYRRIVGEPRLDLYADDALVMA
ncbi:MAG TPA: FAD-dependent oxidoreductase [Humisphaera sp.]